VSIPFDAPHAGPHRTVNVLGDVFVTMKASQTVARIRDVYVQDSSTGEWSISGARHSVEYYNVLSSPSAPKVGPVFINFVQDKLYATLDAQGAIAEIDPTLPPTSKEAVTFIHMPENCSVPVGMIQGYDKDGATPDGLVPALWFTCGKDASADGPAVGSGNFGRLAISPVGPLVETFHTDAGAAASGAYLHLTWMPPTKDGFPVLGLMSSSIFGGHTLDGYTLAFMSKDFTQVLKNGFTYNMIQGVMNHRIVSVGNSWFTDGTESGTLQTYHAQPRFYNNVHDSTADFSGSGSLHAYGMSLPAKRVIYDDMGPKLQDYMNAKLDDTMAEVANPYAAGVTAAPEVDDNNSLAAAAEDAPGF
jgi:hypothetical protein